MPDDTLMPDRSYEEGLRDGRIEALEATTMKHEKKLETHDNRITAQERITYGLLAIIAFIQLWPKLEQILGG